MQPACQPRSRVTSHSRGRDLTILSLDVALNWPAILWECLPAWPPSWIWHSHCAVVSCMSVDFGAIYSFLLQDLNEKKPAMNETCRLSAAIFLCSWHFNVQGRDETSVFYYRTVPVTSLYTDWAMPATRNQWRTHSERPFRPSLTTVSAACKLKLANVTVFRRA
jgi:hypothetical protein